MNVILFALLCLLAAAEATIIIWQKQWKREPWLFANNCCAVAALLAIAVCWLIIPEGRHV